MVDTIETSVPSSYILTRKEAVDASASRVREGGERKSSCIKHKISPALISDDKIDNYG